MENNIKEFMESKENEMIKLQKSLTQIPALAPENNGEGESEKANFLINWLKNKGFTNIDLFKAKDSRVSSNYRPNILVTIPGKTKEVIWIMAHLDVVPPGNLSLWDTNPWQCREKEGKLFGRGCEDNQQGLVSAIYSALYFIENNLTPKFTIKLLFAADEENGSKYGCEWLINNTNIFNKNDMVIIPDGGDKKGVFIEIAEKNILWLKFKVSGKQAHGSRPDQGINASIASDDLALRLHRLENYFNKHNDLFEPKYSTFQPTKHEANVDGVNIIPGEDIFYMDCRIIPDYTIDDVLVKVDKTCFEIENEYNVKVKYSIVQETPSSQTSKDSKIVEILSKAIKKAHNQTTQCIGIGGGTVAGELRGIGMDCAVWSTLDNLAHQPNEYCRVDNMIKDAITLATIFDRYY